MTPQVLDVSALISPDRVVVLPGAPSKALVISALADLATADLPAHDRVAFIRAVLEREDVTTTAIGSAVAIPHARNPAVTSCRIAIGVIPSGTTWGAADGVPVRLALLIAARESDHAEHLRVMAALAMRLRRPGLAVRVAQLTDHDAIAQAVIDG